MTRQHTPINRYGDPMDYYEPGLTCIPWECALRDSIPPPTRRRSAGINGPLLAVRLSESNNEQGQAETLLNALVCGIIDRIARKWNVLHPENREDRNERIPWALKYLEKAVRKLPVPISRAAAAMATIRIERRHEPRPTRQPALTRRLADVARANSADRQSHSAATKPTGRQAQAHCRRTTQLPDDDHPHKAPFVAQPEQTRAVIQSCLQANARNPSWQGFSPPSLFPAKTPPSPAV